MDREPIARKCRKKNRPDKNLFPSEVPGLGGRGDTDPKVGRGTFEPRLDRKRGKSISEPGVVTIETSSRKVPA